MKEKTQKFYRFLSVFAPTVSILCAGGVSIYEFQRLKQLEAATVASEKKLTAVERELRDFAAQPRMDKVPTEEKTPREQALFLDYLRANADASHVQLIRWSNTTPPPAAPAANGQPAPGALPPGVSAIISIVEVSGQTNNTRQFLYALMRSRRLLNMSDLKWIRENWPLTHLTFTLTRYVGPAIHSPLESPAAAGTSATGTPSSAQGNSTQHASGSAANSAPTAPSGNESFAAGPINTPGLDRRAFQSKLDQGVQQLTEADHSHDSSRPGPPAPPPGRR